MGDIKDIDLEIIRNQLGREPKGVIDIPVRCDFGYPVVLTTKPILIEDENNFEIFPTLYWLSCPRRVEEISRFESDGYIEKLEGELMSDPDLKTEYREDEARYLKKQRDLLTKSEKEFLSARGLDNSLKRGIGGIESDRYLKCLHLHLAHELAERNAIGKLIKNRFGPGDCPPDDVRCEKYEISKE